MSLLRSVRDLLIPLGAALAACSDGMAGGGAFCVVGAVTTAPPSALVEVVAPAAGVLAAICAFDCVSAVAVVAGVLA
jgi:hypothetical protein